jgi:hypothetical protein
VGPRNVLDAVKRKILILRRESKPRTTCQQNSADTPNQKLHCNYISELVGKFGFQYKTHHVWGTVIHASCSSTDISPCLHYLSATIGL